MNKNIWIGLIVGAALCGGVFSLVAARQRPDVYVADLRAAGERVATRRSEFIETYVKVHTQHDDGEIIRSAIRRAGEIATDEAIDLLKRGTFTTNYKNTRWILRAYYKELGPRLSYANLQLILEGNYGYDKTFLELVYNLSPDDAQRREAQHRFEKLVISDPSLGGVPSWPNP